MTIKRLRFSFDVPITQLLGLIATGNVDMKVDAYADEKPDHAPKLINGAAKLLLEGPKKPHGNAGKRGGSKVRGKDASGKPLTAYNAILRALTKAPDHTLPLAKLRPLVAELGLKESSANSQINLMRTHGHARRTGEGTYAATPRGLSEAVNRGLVREARTSPKHKTTLRTKLTKHKKKPPPQEVEIVTPVATEETNG